MQTGSHSFTVTLDEDDLIEAFRPPARHGRLARLALLLALMLALLIVALVIRFPEARPALARSPIIIGLTGAVVLAATLVIAIVTAAPWLRRRAARSALDYHPGMRDPITHTIDEDHFTVETTYTRSSWPWDELWDWRETDRVLIVMPTPRNFHVLPKRQIGEGVQEHLRHHLARCRCRHRRD